MHFPGAHDTCFLVGAVHSVEDGRLGVGGSPTCMINASVQQVLLKDRKGPGNEHQHQGYRHLNHHSQLDRQRPTTTSMALCRKHIDKDVHKINFDLAIQDEEFPSLLPTSTRSQ